MSDNLTAKQRAELAKKNKNGRGTGRPINPKAKKKINPAAMKKAARDKITKLMEKLMRSEQGYFIAVIQEDGNMGELKLDWMSNEFRVGNFEPALMLLAKELSIEAKKILDANPPPAAPAPTQSSEPTPPAEIRVREDYTLHGLENLPDETKVSEGGDVTLGDLREAEALREVEAGGSLGSFSPFETAETAPTDAVVTTFDVPEPRDMIQGQE